MTVLTRERTTADRRWWVLVTLCLSELLVVIDNTIVNVALPTISGDLDATTSQLQWVVDGYTVTFASLLLLGGHLGDRLGRRRMLTVGLVGFGVASALTGFAPNVALLITGRAVMGATASLIFPATLSLLVATFTDRRERATAVGIWSAVSGLAVAIGPVAGGILLEHFWWGSVLLINVPMVAVALAAGRLVLRAEFRDPNARGLDVPGAVGSIGGIGLLVWTTIEAPGNGWGSVTTLVGYVAAAALLTGFLWWESRRPHPLLDVSLFRSLRFSAAGGAIALAFFALFGFIFLITQYFQVVRGYGTLQAGLATLPFAVVTGVCSPLAIILMRALGTKVVVVCGLLLMASGFVVASTTSLESAYWGTIIVSMALMAAGLGLVTGPATEAVMGTLRPDQAGAGSAVNDTVREVGGTLGVAVIGSVLSTVYGPRVATALAGAPQAVIDTARESVHAGVAVAAALPGPSAGAAVEAVKQAFVDGTTAGSTVAAIACAVGAVGALLFLPARHRPEATDAPATADAH